MTSFETEALHSLISTGLLAEVVDQRHFYVRTLVRMGVLAIRWIGRNSVVVVVVVVEPLVLCAKFAANSFILIAIARWVHLKDCQPKGRQFLFFFPSICLLIGGSKSSTTACHIFHFRNLEHPKDGRDGRGEKTRSRDCKMDTLICSNSVQL